MILVTGASGQLGRHIVEQRVVRSGGVAGSSDRVRNDFAKLVGHPPHPLACLAQELFGTHGTPSGQVR